ncbi:MAG: Wzz/FepE/Etk N-terminal domain-containing protein, partial [Schleiferiaceae bacterium]|nr:Wzz/FepE/Etk N-terminal domain-containing protein [Schleiferiaceae bacterium]MDR9442546.1 Wzz/FepE/Etk N-terminal domain-containing protein [Schleiferiaceae bacterium]
MENQDYRLENRENNDEIDIKALLGRILSYWPLIIASIVLALFIAFVVNRYATNTYELQAIVHLKESENPLLSENVSLAFNWGGASDLVKSHTA